MVSVLRYKCNSVVTFLVYLKLKLEIMMMCYGSAGKTTQNPNQQLEERTLCLKFGE